MSESKFPWDEPKPEDEPVPHVVANRICARCRKTFYLGEHDTKAEMNPALAICPVCEPESYPDRVRG